MPEISLDENHNWFVDGVKTPGVTRMISDMGLADFSQVPAPILKAAQDFGTAVHKATELDDANDLDIASLDPALVPYVEAWRKFKSENSVEIIEREANHYNKVYRYCGKPDALAIVRSTRTVIDIKSSTVMAPATAIQTAGYAEFYGAGQVKRLGVQLKSDGDYKLYPYNNYADRNIFLYCVSMWWWRKYNGLIKDF